MVTPNSLAKRPLPRPGDEPAKPAPASAPQDQTKTIVFNGRTYTCPYAGLMPSHDPDEAPDLRRDIAIRGVQTPVVVTDHGR